MNKDEIFAIWAPADSPWSTWVKPVLFAHLDDTFRSTEPSPPPPDLRWYPPLEKRVAIVVDLPGAESVWMGVALAQRGYRPVPLFNAVPFPGGRVVLDPLTRRNVAAVDVLPILAALWSNTPTLAGSQIAPTAPPVFLLDFHRQGDGQRMLTGEFDNRSICFTTDFPSAIYFNTQGIHRVMLVQRAGPEPQPDLAHVFRRWQEGGIALEILRVDFPAWPERLSVSRPPWFGAMFQRALAAFGLRRARGGGFGAWVPESSGGG